MADVRGFFGENRPGSNFYILPRPIQYNSLLANNVESLYQAVKSLKVSERIEIAAMSPRDAKWAGRHIKLRSDWEDVKIPIMRELLHLKFEIPEMRNWLLGTGSGYLEETNTWGDRFWGVCNGSGQNHLGILLMREREVIRKLLEMRDGT